MRLHYSLLVTLAGAARRRYSDGDECPYDECDLETTEPVEYMYLDPYTTGNANAPGSANSEPERQRQRRPERRPRRRDDIAKRLPHPIEDEPSASSHLEQAGELRERWTKINSRKWRFGKSNADENGIVAFREFMTNWYENEAPIVPEKGWSISQVRPKHAWIYHKKGRHNMIYIRWEGLPSGYDTYRYDWSSDSATRPLGIFVAGEPGETKAEYDYQPGAFPQYFNPVEPMHGYTLYGEYEISKKISWESFHAPGEWLHQYSVENTFGFYECGCKAYNCISFVSDICHEMGIKLPCGFRGQQVCAFIAGAFGC